MLLSRRRFVLTGLIAAPAVIAIDRLMPVKIWNQPDVRIPEGWFYRDYGTGKLWFKKCGKVLSKPEFNKCDYINLNGESQHFMGDGQDFSFKPIYLKPDNVISTTFDHDRIIGHMWHSYILTQI